LPNVEGIVVDQVVFRCSICRSVREIFAIIVESCRKSRRNLDVLLALPNFGGRAFHKLYTHYHPCLAARCLEKFREDNSHQPEVIEAHALNFKANFKFSRSIFFLGGGPPSQLGCALVRLGQSLARVKILGRSTSYGLKYSDKEIDRRRVHQLLSTDLCPNSTRRTRTEPDRTGQDPTRHSVRVSGLRPGLRHVWFWLKRFRPLRQRHTCRH